MYACTGGHWQGKEDGKPAWDREEYEEEEKIERGEFTLQRWRGREKTLCFLRKRSFIT